MALTKHIAKPRWAEASGDLWSDLLLKAESAPSSVLVTWDFTQTASTSLLSTSCPPPLSSPVTGHCPAPPSPHPHSGHERVPSSLWCHLCPALSEPCAGSGSPSAGLGHTPQTAGLGFKNHAGLDAPRGWRCPAPPRQRRRRGKLCTWSPHGAHRAAPGAGQRQPCELLGREERPRAPTDPQAVRSSPAVP